MGGTSLSELLVFIVVAAFALPILQMFLKPARRRPRQQSRNPRAPQIASKSRSAREPRFARKRFLSTSEARVLPMLEAALPQRRIMAQVAMGALLEAGESSAWQARFTRYRFAQKIVDFVIVSRETDEVLAIVELDDRTHSLFKDMERDTMTAAAGYRTIRIAGHPRPTLASVRQAVADLAPASAASESIGTTGRVLALPGSGVGSG